jgi:2-oxoisovalerate dehydrogenase E2 component (dihydrolipoyl transacylase)
VDVDATELWRLRESTRTPDDPGPGILAYLARFTVEALLRHPVFNSRLDGDDIVEHDEINLGIATQTPRGLVVPAVRGAQNLTLAGLDAEIRRVTASGRDGDGTFTLNNYGGLNVDGSAAIINHPQVAILGFGRMLERPWVVGGEITIRRITQMSFVFDHRVSDGGEAAAFMRDVADAIENPLPAIVRW